MKQCGILLALLGLYCAAAHADPGFYVQGEVGPVAITSDESNGGDFVLLSSDFGFGGRVSGGYLWNNDNLYYGVELGALYYPNIDSDITFGPFEIDNKYEGVNVDLLGVLKYVFDSGFTVFAKAGGAYVYQKTANTVSATFDNVTGSLQLTNNSGSKIMPAVALGLGYQFNPNWEVDLTANGVFTGTTSSLDSNPAATTTDLLVGVTYHFV
jgi:hypothetical protein